MKRQKCITNKYGERVVVIATGILSKLKGNKDAYFSLTGEEYKATKSGQIDKRYGDYLTCGCIHDNILKAFPDMEDLVALYLSDINGVPTYAVENGLYWLGFTKFQKFDIEVSKKHFRANADEVLLLKNTYEKQGKDAYVKLIEEVFKPRWKKEAEDAIKKYGLTVVFE